MIMFELFMRAAENPITPIIVLCAAGLLLLVEAWKESHQSLMGDLYADFGDE